MLSLIVTISFVHLLAVMSPGPDFLFVTRTAVSQSRAKAMAGVVGIVVGIVVWAGASFLGLQILFEKAPWLQRGIAALGGLYLLWMGWQLLRGALAKPQAPAEKPGADAAAKADEAEAVPAASEAATAAKPMAHPFLMGLFTNLSNPKAVIYFGSVFSAFLGPDIPEAVRWGIFLLVIVISLAWFAFVALLFGLPQLRRGYRRIGRWIDGVAGVLFVGFGGSLLWNASKEFLAGKA